MLECLFDEGNVLNTFNMTKQIEQVRSLSEKLTIFSDVKLTFI